MAVTSVNMAWSGRGATDTHLNHRTYREEWEIITDNPLDNEQLIGNAVGLPQVGSVHRNDPTAYAVAIDMAQSEDSPYHWRASIRYDSKPELPEALNPAAVEGSTPAEPGARPENPLLRPTIWAVTFQKTTEAATKWRVVDNLGALAALNTPIRNSAKLPFDPAPQIEVSRIVLRATKNIARADLAFFLRLQDALNDRIWLGLEPRVARIDGVTASGRFENGVAYAEVSLDIALKNDTWDSRILDCGYATLDERTNLNPPPARVQTWTKIRDPFGQEATEPVPLDGSGKKLAPNAEPVFLRGMPANYHLEDFKTILGIG